MAPLSVASDDIERMTSGTIGMMHGILYFRYQRPCIFMAHTLDCLRAAGPSFIPEETHRFSEKMKTAYERNSVLAKAVQYVAGHWHLLQVRATCVKMARPLIEVCEKRFVVPFIDTTGLRCISLSKLICRFAASLEI